MVIFLYIKGSTSTINKVPTATILPKLSLKMVQASNKQFPLNLTDLNLTFPSCLKNFKFYSICHKLKTSV